MVDRQTLRLEFFSIQDWVCLLLDPRRRWALRRCFATMDGLLMVGDPEVRPAVVQDFFEPHLLFHPKRDRGGRSMSAALRIAGRGSFSA